MSWQKAVLFPIALIVQLIMYMLSNYKPRTLYYNYSKECMVTTCMCLDFTVFFLFFKLMQLQVWHLWNICSTSAAYIAHTFDIQSVYCVMYSMKEEKLYINTTQLSIVCKHSYKIQWKLLCSFITKTVLNSYMYLFPRVKTMLVVHQLACFDSIITWQVNFLPILVAPILTTICWQVYMHLYNALAV